MNKIKRSERGQAMVMIAMGAIVLLGIAGLAIDGGMVYADRRHAQNAADASALAGAGIAALQMDNDWMTWYEFACGTADVNALRGLAANTAINRASSNDYTIDADITDNHGVYVDCVPDSSSGGWVDKYLDVMVDITRTTSTSLIHIVYSGPVQNQVEAVARLRPRFPIGFGNAIVALNDEPCDGNENGVVLGGSSQNLINGGGILTNGCLTGNGTSFLVDVTNGGVTYGGSTQGEMSNINPPPQPMIEPLPEWSYTIPPPDCTGLSNMGGHHGAGTINPGIYTSISLPVGDLVMNPGLYCLTGGPVAFSANGGTINAQDVTIYLMTGGVTILGNVEPLDMRAPDAVPDPYPALDGVLFYLAEGNSSTINITGNSETYFQGLIYAPESDVNIAGNEDTNPTLNTQIVGLNVQIDGNADIDILFDKAYNYTIPPMIDLQK